MKKLYIHEVTPIKSLKDLIRNLFTYSSGARSTYALPTYLDKECTKVECAGQRRSFEDLLCLARTYFPDTTELELFKAMLDVGLRVRYCGDINKIVFAFGCCDVFTKDTLRYYIERPNRPYATGTYTPTDLLKLYEQL